MLNDLNTLLEKYRKKLALRLVILFGSRARGDYTDRSDIDILVVADDLPKD
ncbi:MAG: nucleotidyltransferase domain-containing protein, partial [Ignisphaera sp.]